MFRTSYDHTVRRLLTALACAAAVLSAPAGVCAQGLFNPLPNIPSEPELSRSDMRVLTRVLGLTEPQRELVGAIHDEYLTELRDGFRRTRRDAAILIEEARLTSSDDPFHEASDLIDAWEEKREEMGERLLTDLRLTLSAEQEDLWPRLERELLRMRRLGAGRLVGESADLIALTDAAVPDWPEREELRRTLESWARQVTALIERRDAHMSEELQQAYRVAIKTDDAETAEEIYHDTLPKRQAIRDLNVRTLRRVLELVPDDAAWPIERAFCRSEFPYVLRTSLTERRLAAAPELPAITPEQRDKLAELHADYDTELRGVLRGIFEALVASQDEHLPKRIERIKRNFDENGAAWQDPDTGRWIQARAIFTLEPDPAVEDAKQAWIELDRRTTEQLRGVLTAEQQDLLPIVEDELIWMGDHRDHGL